MKAHIFFSPERSQIQEDGAGNQSTKDINAEIKQLLFHPFLFVVD